MKKIIPIILGFIIVAGGSFYAGMRYDQSTRTARSARMSANFSPEERQARGQQFRGVADRGGAGVNGGFIAGEILSKDEKSMTVKLRDGGSKIVFLSDTTRILKTAEGSSNDLAIGVQVTVMGNANADGSVNAESVQIRPITP